MNSPIRPALGMAALCTSLLLQADGKVWPQIGYARVDIPDQRALIHYTNGVERLVIDTSFVGPGTNFAWIIPVPAPPTVEPVSRAVFSTLQVSFQPRIIMATTPWWILAVSLLCLGWLAASMLRRGVTPVNLLVSFLALLTVGIMLAGALLPARSKASAAPSPVGSLAGVRVLQRQQVGVFDTAILEAREPSALTIWLNSNGFSASSNAAPVLGAYVREGWVFVAARVRRPSDSAEGSSPHPLALTFRTREPVYPLRLTGVDNGPCEIELYVFGPQRAEAQGFQVTRCDRPTYREVFRWPRFEGGQIRVRHEELAALVEGAPVATKLTARLSPSQMKRDAYLRWVPYRPAGARLHAPPAAANLAANVGTSILLFGAGLLGLVCPLWSGRAPSPRWFSRLLIASAAVGTATFLCTPKVGSDQFEVSRRPFPVDAKMLALALRIEIEDERLGTNAARPGPEELSGADFARLVDGMGPYFSWDSRNPNRPVPNPFTGQPIRHERSPGNVWLEPTSEGLNLIWFDFDGAPGFTNEVLSTPGTRAEP